MTNDDGLTRNRRIDDWELMRRVTDMAEHASEEDFIEQVLPQLDGYTVTQLWVLSGMLHDCGLRYLAQFVGYYAQRAETSAALAIEDSEANRIGRPWAGKLLCDYMPSPLRLWGDWREWQARRAVQAEIARKSGGASAKPTSSLTTFLHDWNPTKPS
jgi:hypothetical protein